MILRLPIGLSHWPPLRKEVLPGVLFRGSRERLSLFGMTPSPRALPVIPIMPFTDPSFLLLSPPNQLRWFYSELGERRWRSGDLDRRKHKLSLVFEKRSRWQVHRLFFSSQMQPTVYQTIETDRSSPKTPVPFGPGLLLYGKRKWGATATLRRRPRVTFTPSVTVPRAGQIR